MNDERERDGEIQTQMLLYTSFHLLTKEAVKRLTILSHHYYSLSIYYNTSSSSSSSSSSSFESSSQFKSSYYQIIIIIRIQCNNTDRYTNMNEKTTSSDGDIVKPKRKRKPRGPKKKRVVQQIPNTDEVIVHCAYNCGRLYKTLPCSVGTLSTRIIIIVTKTYI
jgi:hypothetical protein